MPSIEVPSTTPVHCNRCDQAFMLSKPATRSAFCGQRATRLNEFMMCPHCGMTDSHWIYASDLMPKFAGPEVLVKREWACPHCGERRMDWLANDGDDTVTCETCGKVYRI
jgi:rubredoxin